jgi:hypothetical protein
MKVGALPFAALAVVIAACSSNDANANGCPNATDVVEGASCSLEGVMCAAKNMCNTGMSSQAICKQGVWTPPPGCLEGGPAYSPCTQMGGTCMGTCAPGTHSVAAADACSSFMDSCCLPDGDAGAGGDASDASNDASTSDSSSDASGD